MDAPTRIRIPCGWRGTAVALRATSTAMLAAIVCVGAGCDTVQPHSNQMARVAKDWALTIRASQVIPVYPLTEDLMPGDVFLVTTRIEDEVAVYEEKGFLPLDHLLTRLGLEYGEFYRKARGIKDFTNTPYHWDEPAPPDPHGWSAAPRAAFPSYSFSIRRGAGINLAIPVQGVPVALSLLGSGSADGTITIADAYTYGIDDYTIRRKLHEWAAENSDYLRNFEPQEGGRPSILRVVTRVYHTGGVNISLVSGKSFAGSGSAGDAKPFDLLASDSPDAATRYAEAIAAMQNTINSALPGGTLKVAAASSRGIAMNEKFPRPLVIGYLGFDVPILEGGLLGLPVSTEMRLTAEAPPLRTDTAFEFEPTPKADCIERWLNVTSDQEPNPRREELNQWLEEHQISGRSTTWLSSGGEERQAQHQKFIDEKNIPCD